MTTASLPVRVGLAGATGYAGQELIRLLARHPRFVLTHATGSPAATGTRRLPALARVWDGEVVPLDVSALAEASDVVFLALPESASADLAPALLAAGCRVVDLSGAFRLREARARARWYPATGALPEGVAYGLTEFEAEAIRQARLLSNPGCYPTAALLALLPLFHAGLLADDAEPVIDAKSGLSGAGKAPTERTHFCDNHGSVAAYGAFHHRHTPEMMQALGGRRVTFVPHLVPLDRGLMATAHVRLRSGLSPAALDDAYAQCYASAPFVRITGTTLPEIRDVVHTNFCDIGWTFDAETDRLCVVAVIDNLVKGAAGQALQNANLMYDFDERAGLL